MKKLTLTILLNLFAALYICAQTAPAPVISNAPKATDKKEVSSAMPELVGLKGLTAPQFTLKAMNGTEYNLENLRGKIVVVNLWGTFCPPCIAEMPHLNKLVKKYKNKNVIFLAPTPDDKAALPVFLQNNPFNYQVLPNAFDVIGKYAPHKKTEDSQKKGGFMMLLPAHLVIDQKGTVTYHEWGFRKDTTEKLSAEIKRLLAAKAKI